VRGGLILREEDLAAIAARLTRGSMKLLMQDHGDGIPRIQCPVPDCAQLYKSKSHLMGHLQSDWHMPGNADLLCSTCGKKLSSRSARIRHVRSRTCAALRHLGPAEYARIT